MARALPLSVGLPQQPEDQMLDGNDERAPEAGDEHGPRPSRYAHDRHLVVNDGELLDIGPDAETVADVAEQTGERRGISWPQRGRRATDRDPGADGR